MRGRGTEGERERVYPAGGGAGESGVWAGAMFGNQVPTASFEPFFARPVSPPSTSLLKSACDHVF